MLQPQAIAPQGPHFSPLIMGYWRLMEWDMTPQQRVAFIEHHLSLGISTVDHADIYGDYRCEAAFGEALKQAPSLRQRLQIDLNPAAVQSQVRAIDANERRKALDGRILRNHLHQLLLPVRHLSERHRLSRFGHSLNDACVLNGEKSLRDHHEQHDGKSQRRHRY